MLFKNGDLAANKSMLVGGDLTQIKWSAIVMRIISQLLSLNKISGSIPSSPGILLRYRILKWQP
jgi:hypothetical protein